MSRRWENRLFRLFCPGNSISYVDINSLISKCLASSYSGKYCNCIAGILHHIYILLLTLR